MTRARNARNRRAGFVAPGGARARGRATSLRRRSFGWVAGAATTSLLLGGVVALTLDVSPARAADPAPIVGATVTDSYLAGEDVSVDITLRSAGVAAGDQYNLSLGVVLPEGVTVLDTGTLGTPFVLPADPSDPDRIIPGRYATVSGDCTVLGLEPADPMPAAPNDNACQVPVGKQYLVFQNISDLPEGAATSHTLTLRPDADVFPVGSTDLELDLTAYTSSNERFIPLFPGSKGLALDDSATSAPGAFPLDIPVRALRITKSEPSPESELLRGVHSETTTYTLHVHHTGEGDVTDTTVVDFLPAGLEYLGLGATDNTTNANGTRGGGAASIEYPGAERLTETPAPSPAPGAWQTAGETVETVIPTATEVADYGLEAGKVYTKVTWDLGTLLATGDARDTEAGIAQVYSGTAGEPGLIEIRYRAGVPLFENTLDFDGAGGQPATPGAQIANLDNNRGASTRHGHPEDADGDAPAKSYTNVAVASGEYEGAATEDFTAYTIDAVDVRVVKEVDDPDFVQTQLARFTLHLAASEYTSAVVPGPAQTPYRILDDMADGICPVFGPATVVQHTPGNPHSTESDPVPNLALVSGGTTTDFVSVAAWNAALTAAGVNGACGWDPDGSTLGADDELDGAQLIGIAFDQVTGHFLLDLAIDPATVLEPSVRHDIEYSVRQNETYRVDGGEQGATSSGDSVANDVEIVALTTSIDALDDVTSAGSTHPDNSVPGDIADGVWNASDDSAETLTADFSRLEKQVLQRSAGAYAPEDIAKAEGAGGPDAADWVDVAPDPFAIGDEVWYRIRVTPPSGTDVRNPRLTDFLPQGVEFDPVDSDTDGRPDNMWIVPSSPNGLGSCVPADATAWLNEFVPFGPANVNDNVLTFNLGSADCLGPDSTDRFLPLDTTLSVYLKVTVTDISAFGTVDMPENLAKYQQQNVDGDIFFLRDAAEIELDQAIGLVKGIRDVNGDPSGPFSPYGNDFRSDVDGEEVVQGDEVTFRLDVSAPEVASTDLVIWDALPVGVKKADIKGVQPDGTLPIGPGSTASAVELTWQPPQDGPPPVPGRWLIAETPLTSGWTATVYDFGDYPTDVETHLRDTVYDEERSIVVWEFTDTIAPSILRDENADSTPRGLSLGYTVVVPAGTTGGGASALLEQEYENDASIVRYSPENANIAGTQTVLVPTGDQTLSTEDADDIANGVEIDQRGTYDDSWIYLPGAEIDKRLVSTDVGPVAADGDGTVGTNDLDPGNAQGVIVQGEFATYDVSVEIPANTTVREGVLADLGNLVGQGSGSMSPNTSAYQLESATFPVATRPAGITVVEQGTDPAAPHATDFVFNTATGKLTFPEYYTTGTTAETFTVRLVVWTPDVDESHPSASPSISDGKVLRNTATFDSKDVAGDPHTRIEASADVTYREPSPTLAKTVTGTLGADGEVTFTLTAGNAAGRPALYDAVVYDCLPTGFELVAVGTPTQGTAAEVAGTPCEVAGTGAAQRIEVGTGTGTLVTWMVGQLNGGVTETLEVTARVDPAAGGGATYTNHAHIAGLTLPSTLDPLADTRSGDRATGASRDVDVSQATLTKSVSPSSAPVGDTVAYTVTVTLPAYANFYDVTLTDTLPAGVSYVAGSSEVTIDWDTAVDEPTVGTVVGAAQHEPTISGSTLSWAIAADDVAMHTADRTITLEFDAILDGVGDSVTSVTNEAEFAWSTEDGGGTRLTDDDDAVVTILDPVLQIVKKVDGLDAATYDPHETFDYTIVVSQTAAGGAPAHHITVQDAVPAGVKVDTTQAALAGATFSDATALQDGLGGIITWQLAGPLDVAGGAGTTSIELGYEASFVDSTGLTAAALTNTANVTHFESFDNGGREYDLPADTSTDAIFDTASVTPLFPDVVPTKTVTTPVSGETYGVAEAGEPFNWTLTVANEGTGTAKDLSVTDLLPTNWEYDPGSAFISVAGDPAVALADPALSPATVDDGDQQELVWSDTAIRAAGGADLAAGDAFVITFDAIPTDWALGDAGTGIEVHAHTNTLSVTATDTQDNDTNATDDYVGPPSTADAYIARMDLLLHKTGIGGVTDSTAFGGLATGTWLAGQGVVTGYAQPQWEIVITNQGPDDGHGPFVVTDTMSTLPDEVTVGAWSARYYSSATDTTGTDLGASLTGGGVMTLGTSSTTLKADGSDRIVLLADVTIDADAYDEALPGTLTLDNEASVTGATYEDPDDLGDNTDDDSTDVAELADLSIAKVVTDPTSTPVVGSSITWEITVTNLGPSVSRSTTTDPITISDTVPTGMTGVTAIDSADWTATLDDGTAIPAEGVDAGAVIVWTYTGSAMPVGATAPVSLTGTILTSQTGTLTNTASVAATETPDPAMPNDESEVPVTPDDTTQMDITKTRVVPDGTGWRQADPTTEPGDAFVAGEPVHYLITVTNEGPADARDVTVVDEAPEGLTYQTHVSVEGTWTRTAGGTTSAYPSGAPTGRAFDTFTLTTGPQPETDDAATPAVPATAFVVTYDTDSTITEDVENWAEVTIDNWDPADPTGTFDRDDDETGATRIVDLGIEKSHTGTGTFTPGTEVEYTLVVTNHGPSATNGVIEVTDALDEGMSYSDDTSPTITVPTGTTAPTTTTPALSGTDDRVLTWELLEATDTFDVGETITITYRVLIDPLLRAAAVLDNTAEVDGPDTEPVPDPHANKDDDSVTTGDPEADMTIAKTVEAGPWVAGTEVEYTLTITNDGPSAAPATVTDTLPTGLTIVSMAGTNWDCDAVVAGAGSGTCTYQDEVDTAATGLLHPLGTSTITVVAAIAPTVVTGTDLDNEAVLSWTDGGGSHSDDDDVTITVTTNADLGIVKDVITGAAGTVVADPAPATAGETVWYRLQVTNHGPSDAVGPITVTDELPLGVTVPATLTSVGPWTVVPGAIVAGTAQTVTFTLTGGLLANTTDDTTRGVADVIEFEAQLDTAVAHGATLTNDAAVSSPTPDSDSTNDEDDADILVDRLVDLGVTKSHPVDANGQVVIDQPLDFTIGVTNHGPSEASGITIVDTIPAGVEITSVTGTVAGTGWTIDSIVLVDPLDPLGGADVTATYAPVLGVTSATNEADPLVISTIVRESAVGTSPNHVEVSGAESEPSPDPTPNEFDDPLDVLPRVTLVVTKTAVGAFQVGKRGSYEITVENLGPHDDPGPLEVEDVLPAGLTYYGSAHPGVAVAGQTVTWTIPSLAVGDVESITLVVDVHQAAYPSVTNLATVTTPSELTPASDPDDDDTVPVAEADPIALTGLDTPLLAFGVGLLLLLAGIAITAAAQRRRRTTG